MNQSARHAETIRIALVMNGGVSLAVWMGGVTHEIQRLLSASQAPTDDVSGWANALLVPGQDDEPATYRKVLVDSIAGTSAGGLNGTILATALARGSLLPALKDLWLDKGALTVGSLLAPPGARGSSLLDGDFFHSAIKESLEAIPHNTSRAQKVTLLVTATAMTGGKLKVEDSNDHPIDVTDHRRVYKFESKDGDAGQFRDSTTLAAAGRASASFPVAFAPVPETEELARLRTPQSTAANEGTTWLIDGGVLDNAPFEPLLREIVDQPRADSGRRLVVYVVPYAAGFDSDETMGTTSDDDRPSWLSVLGRLKGLWGENDLRNDLSALRAYGAAARDINHAPEEMIVTGLGMTSDQVSQLLPLYRLTRVSGFVRYLRESYTQVEKLGAEPVDAVDVSAVLAKKPYFVPASMEPTDANGQWQWGVVVARRMTLWMSRQARQAGADDDVLELLANVEVELKAANDRIDAEYALPMFRNQSPTYVLRRSQSRVLHEVEPIPAMMANAVRSWAATVGLSPEQAWAHLAQVEVMTNFDEWHRRATPPPMDVVLVDTAEGSVAKFVLSADESLAKAVHQKPNEKLYGTRLFHFGSFGHADYRAHDWTWGRLDGALCLASALTKGMDGSVQDSVRAGLVANVLDDEGISLEELVSQTARVHGMSNTELILDIRRRGEADLPELIASVRSSLLAVTPAGALLEWAERVKNLDGTSLVLQPLADATDGIRGWLRDRVADLRRLL